MLESADTAFPVAYVALNTFMDPSVATSFEEKLPILRGCSGIILDLRKNHGGQDDTAYRIASTFLRQPAERLLVHSRKHIANYRAAGAAMKEAVRRLKERETVKSQ